MSSILHRGCSGPATCRALSALVVGVNLYRIGMVPGIVQVCFGFGFGMVVRLCTTEVLSHRFCVRVWVGDKTVGEMGRRAA